MSILQCIILNCNMIEVICSVCMLLVTILYVAFTWQQSKYTKRAFLEAVKQAREERQPYIIPTIECVSGEAHATSNYLRVQLSFHCKMENVGDSTAVSIYAFLYAKMQHTQEEKIVYADLIPKYNYSIAVGKAVEKYIHFETSQFRDIVEDLEISHVKNMKRIETNPHQESYKGPEIILRVLYKNMMEQWFESELVQELLEITHQSNDANEYEEMVVNMDVANGDVYTGRMIAPNYSHITRRMVTADYVKEVLKDCDKNTKMRRFEIEKFV